MRLVRLAGLGVGIVATLGGVSNLNACFGHAQAVAWTSPVHQDKKILCTGDAGTTEIRKLIFWNTSTADRQVLVKQDSDPKDPRNEKVLFQGTIPARKAPKPNEDPIPLDRKNNPQAIKEVDVTVPADVASINLQATDESTGVPAQNLRLNYIVDGVVKNDCSAGVGTVKSTQTWTKSFLKLLTATITRHGCGYAIKVDNHDSTKRPLRIRLEQDEAYLDNQSVPAHGSITFYIPHVGGGKTWMAVASGNNPIIDQTVDNVC